MKRLFDENEMVNDQAKDILMKFGKIVQNIISENSDVSTIDMENVLVSEIQYRCAVTRIQRSASKKAKKCSMCGTTVNVRYVGGDIPYLCDSKDCIPY